MEKKHLIWIVPLILSIGIIIGIFVLPKEIEIKFEVVNETKGWLDEQYFKWENLTDFNMTNMCCFPSECEQAKNNPELCTCIYMVECFKT